MEEKLRVRRIGLTGGIASGKSTVTELLRKMGFTVLDADAMYHELVAANGALLPRLVEAFGEDILAADGSLDRRAFAKHIFAEKAAREKLDAITHPAVYHELDRLAKETISQWKIQRTRKTAEDNEVAHRLLFFDIPLLMESFGVSQCLSLDRIWLVTAPEAMRKQRLMVRDGLSEEEAKRRLAAQMSEDEKQKKADVILTNDADLEKLKKIVEEAVRGEEYA